MQQRDAYHQVASIHPCYPHTDKHRHPSSTYLLHIVSNTPSPLPMQQRDAYHQVVEVG